ncbi:Tfp pilus assembly protein FimT/FimU [Acidisphaera sp. L21]|uniref:pilus assembly FimT family protein n=1 Tax=Acidisphaera sp. L21 TaxID=1641851 RepID=UPI00131ABF27|nr:GspH/FimT family pseudopilin [Acidisphaera sp. L21]
MTRHDDGGFTLIEMLVVLVVLGIMIGLVVAHGPSRSAGLDARMAANMLAGTLRAARSEAIAADRSVTVVVDGSAGTVRVGGRPARLIGARVAAGQPIVFAPDGSSGGGQIAVTAGTVHKAIAVDWLTGRVSIVDAR